MEAEEIKAFCKERGWTYGELAGKIGISESTLRSALSTNKITTQVARAIEMIREIEELRAELENWGIFKTLVARATRE
ncbi:MAG: transcriptional regulator [Wolinella sp.]